MIDDLKKIILAFAGIRIPLKTLERVDCVALCNWDYCRRHMQSAWRGRGWTPSLCNQLQFAFFTHKGRRYTDQLLYTAVTGMTPTRKRMIETYRESAGFVPVYPGGRHYPTSRVRFWPKFHTNDRYFR